MHDGPGGSGLSRKAIMEQVDAELHFIRARLRGGILSKARRGELITPLPVGLAYDAAGHVIPDPDTAASWPGPVGVGPFAGDEVTVPAQDRGWGDRPPAAVHQPGQRRKPEPVGMIPPRAAAELKA
jgi:hypothetical protein